jgi:hypothetical protein
MAGQQPFSRIFPTLPEGFTEPFWYASLQSFWVYYRVDPDLLRQRLPELPEQEGLQVALFDFGNGELGGIASLDLQRYTGHGPQYLETTDEVEFNIYVYPTAREADVPLMTWQDYLSGVEQTKTIGGYRLHVPCDNQVAVVAGQGLYGEPKYLAVFQYTVPCINGAPTATAWDYEVYQDLGDPPNPPTPHTPVKGPLIYSLSCDLAGVPSTPASPSPLIEYGVLTPAGGPRVVANFWDFYGAFDTYIVDGLDPPFRVDLAVGTSHDPSGTLDDVTFLLDDAQPIAVQVFTTPPVSAESRGWFPLPAP